jgi:hypothetical protein
MNWIPVAVATAGRIGWQHSGDIRGSLRFANRALRWSFG